jgi:GAF domain-containing protein
MLKSLFRERRRSGAVHDLAVLDLPGDSTCDRFVQAAAAAFDAPIAALSLIHDDRQSVYASHGITTSCLPRGDGFCRHALDRPDVLECCDPWRDDRFARLPSVIGAPHIRYYIGAPLRLLNGVDVGALCVVDTVERAPASPDQKAYLAGLARQAALTLETRMDRWGYAA